MEIFLMCWRDAEDEHRKMSESRGGEMKPSNNIDTERILKDP